MCACVLVSVWVEMLQMNYGKMKCDFPRPKLKEATLGYTERLDNLFCLWNSGWVGVWGVSNLKSCEQQQVQNVTCRQCSCRSKHCVIRCELLKCISHWRCFLIAMNKTITMHKLKSNVLQDEDYIEITINLNYTRENRGSFFKENCINNRSKL